MKELGYRRIKDVSFYQLDGHGRMTPAALLSDLQEVGIAHSDALGFDMEYLLEHNRGWAVINWHIIIHHMPKSKEKMDIFTWNHQMKKMQASRSYRIGSETGECYVEAISRWVYMDLENRHPSHIPEEMIAKYVTGLEASIPDEKYLMPKPIMGEEISTRKLLVTRRDTDTNGHANNVKYLEWSMDDIPDAIYDKMDLFDVRVVYRKECKRGDMVELLTFITEKEGCTEVISLLLDLEGKTIAEVVTLWH